MEKNSKIYVAGHTGLVGSAIKRILEKEGYNDLLVRTHEELDLKDQKATEQFFEEEKPEYVFLAAAKVGGIYANMTYSAEFIYDNLQIQSNVINSAWKSGVKKLLFLGSTCIYPRESPQPIKEEYLMTGKFEPTNEPYAIAKIAGIGMCQAYHKQYGANFISAVPSNLFGVGDNFDEKNSHLIAAMIRKFHNGKVNGDKEVVLWGTGRPMRELIYVDDVADACLFLMNNYNSPEIINIGTGKDLTVKEIAETIKEITDYQGAIVFDSTKPDGMMRKVSDTQKINALGWKAKIEFKEGVKRAYEWFLKNNLV